MIEWTREQKLLREMIREFTEKEIVPRDKWMDENGFDEVLHGKMSEAGIFAVPFEERFGGLGYDFKTATMMIHEVSRGSGSVGINLDAAWFGYDVIELVGTKEQKERYFPLSRDGVVFAFALTEPHAGSDALSIRTRAVRNPDGSWLLSGSKAWITNYDAEYSVVIAKTDPAKGGRGMSAFVVPRDAKGVTLGAPENKSGLRGSMTGEIFFDNVHLAADALLGKEGEGFRYAMQALDSARISMAAISLGIAEHAASLAKKYVNERIAFGKPISQLEGMQFKFADMAAKLHAMELLVYNTAEMRVKGLEHANEAAVTKLLCTEWATEICLEAQQALGGNGISREFEVERLVRDAKINQIAEGTSEVLRMIIGRAYLQ